MRLKAGLGLVWDWRPVPAAGWDLVLGAPEGLVRVLGAGIGVEVGGRGWDWGWCGTEGQDWG